MSNWEPGMWDDYDQEFDQEEGEVSFKAILKHETDKAYLVELEADEQEAWIPKSQVSDVDGEFDEESGELHIGEVYTFFIPSWLAEKKGI